MDDTGRLPLRCLSLDLEVGRRDGRIHAFAAVRAETEEALTFRGGALGLGLARLDAFAGGADCLLGHNLIAFDLPHLAAANPDLRLLRLPAVDTLRLNPLAFPRNPYHRLVKHYQDGQLKRGRVNDPELDARLVLEVFDNQQEKLKALRDEAPDLLAAWHRLAATAPGGAGFDAFFAAVRGAPRPSGAQAHAAIRERLAGAACENHCREILADPARHGWALAYALAWLSVAGGNSVMPPWVRHQFPEAGVLVRRLRDTACNDPACGWCRERHDARMELAHWFGFGDFRPEPMGGDGRPMQRSIVEAAMAGESVLGILPTGTGKSLCYQIQALSRYDKTGALTVVISPLVALMADQVAGLERRGIGSCVTVNGLLSMPERKEALDRVRLGDAGILIVAPEQLRSLAVRRTLEQREIGAWVLDEAHCLSRWGHDFRPDYRYVARFIKERAADAQVLCLTATAKPDVKEDIRAHFRDRLDIDLRVFDGGARRTNLEFVVVQTTPGEKFAHLHQILAADLPPETPGGAIIYCATRRRSEDVAQFLREKDVAADHFHAGLSPEIKKTVQQRFIEGGSRVIAATNAFGMGIDKPDVRLVVHADVPGSLENYLQEAGRAGRDRAAARCVLLYTPEDVERQFGLSARSRLTRREIHGILKALRRLGRKKRAEGKVAGTSSSRAVSSSRPGGRNKKRMEGEVVATAGGGQRPGVYLAQAQARQRRRRRSAVESPPLRAVHKLRVLPVGAEHTPLDTNPALSTCSPRASLRASRHRRRRRQRAPADREGANDAPRSRTARSLRPTNAACSGPCSRGASLAPSVSIDLASFRPARSSHGLQDTPIDEGRCCDVPMARTTDVDGRRQRRAPGRRHAIPAPLATQSRGCMEAPSTNARLVTCRWHGRRSAGYVGCRCPRVTGSRWRAAR